MVTKIQDNVTVFLKTQIETSKQCVFDHCYLKHTRLKNACTFYFGLG